MSWWTTHLVRLSLFCTVRAMVDELHLLENRRLARLSCSEQKHLYSGLAVSGRARIPIQKPDSLISFLCASLSFFN